MARRGNDQDGMFARDASDNSLADNPPTAPAAAPH